MQYVYVYVYVYVRAHWREEPKLEGGAHWEKGGRVEVRGRLDRGSVGQWDNWGWGGDGLGGVARVVVLGADRTPIPSVPI